MNVLFELSSLGRKELTGVGTYIVHLMNQLQNEGCQINGVVKPSRVFKRSLVQNHIHKSIPLGVDWPWAEHKKFDVFHGPDVFIPENGSIPKIMTLHDLVTFHPKFVDSAFAERGQAEVSQFLSRSLAHVIVDTEFTKKELLSRFPSFEGKVSTVLLGGDHLNHVRTPRVRSSRPFFLHLGTIEKRKNVTTLVQAFEILAERHKDVQLVIAGGTGYKGQETLDYIANSKMKDRIRQLGFVDQEQRIELLKTCTAFVMPSFYEGFGLPNLEAMSFSAPVITSDLGAMKEVCGESALLADPHYAEAFAVQMERVLLDTSLQETLGEQGFALTQKLTWKRCAQETLRVYQSVSGKR